ncbi:family 43 glycosylhydrolase [Streptomyces sp. HM190]|uniref:family 43 glycosylhydrolase n=1 Tax=Streptomyces sp. HM190 TaxID=2695266 RepID=UPI001357F20B|nr:family 43 glycosylhydrolase [Streptomyces sp. HM190]
MTLDHIVRRFVCGLALLGAVAGVAAGPSAGAADPPAKAPVIDRDFPDPDIVETGGTYHAYATNDSVKNIQHATSRDLRHWTVDEGDVLPELGAWAVPNPRRVWAPEVFRHGGGYTMHYTAHDRASGRQCIGVARSATPGGPFRPVGAGPLICPAAEGGAIDASSYAEAGRRYVLWKNDGNCCDLRKDTWLHLQPVSWDGTRTLGEPVRLIKQDREWEGPLIEAPTLVKRHGHYLLFYSADFYAGDGYKTSYAVARDLTGPYTKAANPLMTTQTFSGAVRGPGGQDVVTGPDGRDRVVFHGWSADHRSRPMYIADLGYADGYPVVRGSKVVHQAEHARVRNAVVREAPSASGGKAVGRIDHADSHVEFTVFAASAGEHQLSVWFGNGSLDPAGNAVTASHRLLVNGADVGAVRYPHTGWDHWREERTTVTLRDGWNTIRLGKGEYFAELDAVEVG